MARDPRMMWRYTTIGIEFVAAFFMGTMAGNYIDRQRGGRYWTLIGAAVGFGAAMYLLIRSANRFRKEWERKDDQ
jgi:F0F1-type ATP synthase assembly protein I